MKKITYILMVIVLGVSAAKGQQSADSSRWEFNADVNFYFIPDDFLVLPVFRADKNNLHLEARYNYEDLKTFSAWIGYNFKGGNKLEYTITPMIGGVVGLTNGIAPALEVTLNYGRFELYTESEYLFDVEVAANNFYYQWSDFSYAPRDWIWFGISGQRTRIYQTDLDIQRGLFIGTGFKWWELNTYVYNIGFDDPFMLITVIANF